VEEMAHPACRVCTEFANDYADIAVGKPDTPEGYAPIFIRTEKGGRAYSGALRQGYLEEKAFAHLAELRGEQTRMMARAVTLSRRKRERKEAISFQHSAIS